MATEPVGTDGSAAVAEQNGAAEPYRSWRTKIVHGGKRFLGMFLYLWMLFGLFNLHEAIVLARHQIEFTRYGFAFVNAWLLAKIMLVAEDLNIARGFEDRALIYPVLYKSAVFAIVFVVFGLVERMLVGLWHGATPAESVSGFGGGTVAGISSAALIISFALMPYFAFREIGRVIGRSKLRALLFTRPRDPPARPAGRAETEA